VSSLVFAFVDIALHRRGPDQLPASTFLLTLVLAGYLFIVFFALALQSSAAAAAALLVFETAIYLLFVWAVLKAFKRERRFLQTATAMLGVDTLFNALGLPLLAWENALTGAGAETTAPLVLSLLLFVWSIDVSGFILSRALERPYVLGVGIVLGYVMLSYSIRTAFLPPAG
jgi:hypothetical protein